MRQFEIFPAEKFQKQISIQSFASQLGVSVATIRNWIKAGIVPTNFRETDVLRLQEALNSGQIARLRTRANKTTSKSVNIPTEYASHPSQVELVESISSIVHRENIAIKVTLFVLALRVLELRNELTWTGQAKGIFDLHLRQSWKRTALKNEILDWSASLPIVQPNGFDFDNLYYAMKDSTETDILGLVYQALNREGHKSTKGSYYTPPRIVKESLETQKGLATTFLDPCCGTGQYLLGAANVLGLPLQAIAGFDNDEIATRIARINLLLAFPSSDERPNVECLNTITDAANGNLPCATSALMGGIDFIATNPPWGAYKNVQLPRHITGDIKSNEAFSLFLARWRFDRPMPELTRRRSLDAPRNRFLARETSSLSRRPVEPRQDPVRVANERRRSGASRSAR
jgi:N-6 DNA Methylase